MLEFSKTPRCKRTNILVSVTRLFVLEQLGVLELALCVSFQVNLREDALQRERGVGGQRSGVNHEKDQ